MVEIVYDPADLFPRGRQFRDGDFAETLAFAIWPDDTRVTRDGIEYVVWRAMLLPIGTGDGVLVGCHGRNGVARLAALDEVGAAVAAEGMPLVR